MLASFNSDCFFLSRSKWFFCACRCLIFLSRSSIPYLDVLAFSNSLALLAPSSHFFLFSSLWKCPALRQLQHLPKYFTYVVNSIRLDFAFFVLSILAVSWAKANDAVSAKMAFGIYSLECSYDFFTFLHKPTGFLTRQLMFVNSLIKRFCSSV